MLNLTRLCKLFSLMIWFPCPSACSGSSQSFTVSLIRRSNIYHEGKSVSVFPKFALWFSFSSSSKFYFNVTPIFFSSIMNKTMNPAIRSPCLRLSSMTHDGTFRKSLELSIWRVGAERRRVLGAGTLTGSLSCAWVDSLLCSWCPIWGECPHRKWDILMASLKALIINSESPIMGCKRKGSCWGPVCGAI